MMAQATNNEVEDILRAIKELRSSLVSFEHVVNAHLDVLSEKLQHLHPNKPVQTDKQDSKQNQLNSSFVVQSPIQTLELYKVQELTVQPSNNKQFINPGFSSPANTEEEESPCPLPKAFKLPKSDDGRERGTKHFRKREQSLAIPSKRDCPTDDANHMSSGEIKRSLVDPQMSSQKQPKLLQKSESERVRSPASRAENPTAKSSTSVSNSQAQRTNKQLPLPTSEKSIGKSGNICEPPTIKLEERRMWKTIWNAEGSKEPLDQYIIRKRSEAVYRLPKVRANAEEKAVARARKKQEEKASSQNRLTDNQGNNETQPKPVEITKYLKPSSTTQIRNSGTDQETLSHNRTNSHPKAIAKSPPRRDRSTRDESAASKRTLTNNPKTKVETKVKANANAKANANNTNDKSMGNDKICSNGSKNSAITRRTESDNTSTKKKSDARKNNLFYDNSSSTEDTISPKSVDLDRLMENFGAHKRKR